MNFNQLPNIITLLRVILIWPFINYLLSNNYLLAFSIFLIASLSDGVDGYLARRFNWTSRLGGFIDVLADKLLLISSFLVLGFLGVLPLILMSIIIARDIFTVVGVAIYYCLFGKLNLKPSLIGKTNIACQIFLVFLLLFETAFFKLPYLMLTSMIYIMIVVSFASLLEYIWIWSKKTYYNWGVKRGRWSRMIGIMLLLILAFVLTFASTWGIYTYYNSVL